MLPGPHTGCPGGQPAQAELGEFRQELEEGAEDHGEPQDGVEDAALVRVLGVDHEGDAWAGRGGGGNGGRGSWGQL